MSDNFDRQKLIGDAQVVADVLTQERLASGDQNPQGIRDLVFRMPRAIQRAVDARDQRIAELERMLKSALDAWEAGEFDEAKYYELRHALYAQIANNPE